MILSMKLSGLKSLHARQARKFGPELQGSFDMANNNHPTRKRLLLYSAFARPVGIPPDNGNARVLVPSIQINGRSHWTNDSP